MTDLTGAAEDLAAVLRDALPDVTFDMGRIVEKRLHGSISIYASRDEEALSPRRLREIHEGAKWGDKLLRRARQARVNMPESTRSRIAEALRELLDDYVDPESDTVGHAFPMRGDHGGAVKYERDGLYTHANVSSTKRLAEALAQGAAVAGCDRGAELVDGVGRWSTHVLPHLHRRSDNPRTGAVARSGDRARPAPKLQRRTPAAPSFPGKAVGYPVSRTDDRVGRRQDDARPVPTYRRNSTSRSARDPDTRGDAGDNLGWALARITHVGRRRPHLGRLRRVPGTVEWGGGCTRHLGPLKHRKAHTTSMTGVSTVEIHEHGVVNLCEKRLGQRLHELHRADPRTRVSVSRWRSAMGTVRGLADRFIDLRIALECLFLPRQPGPELKFRLAVNGAWFVGKSGTDRRKVWDTLRSAYDLASAAVHQGTVKDNKENRAVPR